MKEGYPATFLRGLSGKTAVTDDGYVLSEAFQFSENKERTKDGMHEMSVNWEDGNEAVDQLLSQKKKDSDAVQFNIGFCRFATAKLKEWFGTHIQNGDFGYERYPVDGNPHHGNLLASPTIKPSVKKNITHTLANMATIDLYKRDSGVSPYLQKDNNKKMAEDKIEKKMPPKVSVIVPVYGVEKYIERCARSLFEQTLDDIEYLFIDDCSPDRSAEILRYVLEDYPQRKKQVVIHQMEQNSGQAAVRRWGIINATGEYVIHCDSDDWVDTDMYRAMYEKAKEEDADVVICQYARTDGETSVPDLTYFNENTIISDMLLERTNWSLVTRLCKRQLYSDIHLPENNMGEDFHIVIQISLKSLHTVYIPTVFYYYYYNPDSICNFPSMEACMSRFDQTLNNFDFIIKKLVDNNIFKNKSAEILNIKNHCRLHLVPYINRLKFYKLWLTTYPEINIPFVYVKGIPLRQRLRFYSRMFGFYPLIARFLHG